MHIYFAGIGGSGIGPLALIAQQAGYVVSGSDKQDSAYLKYIRDQGINDVYIGEDSNHIAAVHAKNPIDWFVYTSALPMENPNHPELRFCRNNSIKTSKRDELLRQILDFKNLELVAIAGTHGKTTTTAMTVWLMQQLGIPISYLLPAKTSFAEMGAFVEGSKYFIYECDEYDRNFLSFNPKLSLITGIDWDHPDIYPTRNEYNQAFLQFIGQSSETYIWSQDARAISLPESPNVHVIGPEINSSIALPGAVNRQNADLVVRGIATLLQNSDIQDLVKIINAFPGVSRRFEPIRHNLYSDYAHTPPKIRGALQLGHEAAGENLVVVYEGLHNTRQHFIHSELKDIFEGIKKLYIVPSYLAREDPSLKLLTPSDLRGLLNPVTQNKTVPSQLDSGLEQAIQEHLQAGDTVLCLSAGGGGSLDEWLRNTFAS